MASLFKNLDAISENGVKATAELVQKGWTQEFIMTFFNTKYIQNKNRAWVYLGDDRIMSAKVEKARLF